MKDKLKQFLTKKRIIAGVIVLAVLLLGAGVVYAADSWDKINNHQLDLFNQTVAPIPEETPEVTAEPTQQVTEPAGTPSDETAAPTETPVPTATVDPEQVVKDQADKSLMNKTLNILLIGVDYADERADWKNKLNFNSDVMLLLIIHFDKNGKAQNVNMVSFPRDTYAKIANIDTSGTNGFYKLNFSLAAGGGINNEGFMNVCDSVWGILGPKVPKIDKYIAVTMPAVKELTDAIGGIDYNVDVNFRIQGREYKKGMQHLNGQGVLDYCRVRKNSGTGYISEKGGDLNRVDRQRRMLLAVFSKIKNSTTIWDVPNILLSMKDKVYTNMDFRQLAALAIIGKDMPEDKITMKSLPTTGTVGLFNQYGFVLQDQAKISAMVKEYYGITREKQYKYDSNYAHLLFEYLCGETWFVEIDKWRTADKAKPVEQQKLTNVEDIAKLDAAVKAAQTAMLKYHDRLFKDTKPVVTSTEWTELQKHVDNMNTVADAILKKAGYKPNWAVRMPEVLDMDE